MSNELAKTVGLIEAIGLAVGIVVGAGMLVLPGIVYHTANEWATMAWLLDGLMVIPLLCIFAWLGKKYPSAGGIAGFVGEAYPWLKTGCSYLLLGTFSLGIPAIALTGASYISDLSILRYPHAATLIASLFIFSALIMASMGAKLSGKIQTLVVIFLVCLLGLIALFGISNVENVKTIIPSNNIPVNSIWTGMTLAFFAFTGWEMLAFTTEEFKNPERDFPLAIAVSFIIVMALYIGSSLAVQSVSSPDEPRLLVAPFLLVAESIFDSYYASIFLVVVVSAIIFANLNGAIWGASRLAFDLGRDKKVPKVFGLEQTSKKTTTPKRAIIFIGVLFFSVLLLNYFNIIDLATLLRLAGQNFFVLYVLSVVSFIKLAPSIFQKIFGSCALGISGIFMSQWGTSLLYAALLLMIPSIISYSNATQKPD